MSVVHLLFISLFSFLLHRYWEAIKKWDEALQLTPGKSSIYEMKAQVKNKPWNTITASLWYT